jgi:hypothetical protein
MAEAGKSDSGGPLGGDAARVAAGNQSIQALGGGGGAVE